MGPFPLVRDFFDSPLWGGEHAPLVLGWNEEQLAPILGILRPSLPGDLTQQMLSATAACARSLVVDTRLTGQPLRYSRHRDHYGGAKRYRRGDRYYTFHYVTKAVSLLVRIGLAGHAVGEWLGSGGGGRQSVVWPTEDLRQLLEPAIDAAELRGVPGQGEVIVLRGRHDKEELDYEDTDETAAMRAEIQALNAALGVLELYWSGKPFPIPLLRRVFNGEWCRGGRCYCHGLSFQNIPAEERLNLQLRINGVLHRMVEIDYGTLHIVMAYAEAGMPLPPGDQYAIDSFDRKLVKRAVNVLLNAETPHLATSAIVEELHRRNYDLWRRSGLVTRDRKACWPLAKAVVAAILDKHHQIAAYFGSDCGSRFQRRDSEMAIRVMKQMIARTGRCPLPMHDSLLVADLDQEVLAQTMLEVASEEGLVLCLKDSQGLRRWGPSETDPASLGGNNP